MKSCFKCIAKKKKKQDSFNIARNCSVLINTPAAFLYQEILLLHFLFYFTIFFPPPPVKEINRLHITKDNAVSINERGEKKMKEERVIDVGLELIAKMGEMKLTEQLE